MHSTCDGASLLNNTQNFPACFHAACINNVQGLSNRMVRAKGGVAVGVGPTQNNAGLISSREANVLWGHDLIGGLVLHHAVLMDPTGMLECVCSHYGLQSKTFEASFSPETVKIHRRKNEQCEGPLELGQAMTIDWGYRNNHKHRHARKGEAGDQGKECLRKPGRTNPITWAAQKQTVKQFSSEGQASKVVWGKSETLCGCIGMPLKSVTILLAEAMCTGRMPVRSPPIWSSLQQQLPTCE